MIHPKTISIAPLYNISNYYYRTLWRVLSKNTIVYTEMIVDRQLLNNSYIQKNTLNIASHEHPINLQLGGSNIKYLLPAILLCKNSGYNEININMGCPSDRASGCEHGAVLMRNSTFPNVIRQINNNLTSPVTIKCRIGIDELDTYEFLFNLIKSLSDVGVNTFILHARKAIMGLTTEQNRNIPPLNYEMVYRLKRDFKLLKIIINGGIKSRESIIEQFKYVDGVMIGREAYQNPCFVAQFDKILGQDKQILITRRQIINNYLQLLPSGSHKARSTAPLIQLFKGKNSSTIWKEQLLKNLKLETPENVSNAIKVLIDNGYEEILDELL